MIQLYDADGNKVDAIPQTELETEKTKAADAAIEAFKKDSPEMKELETAKAKVTELETSLAGMSDKDKNFEALRIAKEKAEGKVTDLEGKITSEIEGLKNLVNENQLKETIAKLADGDEELAKKIKFHYNANVKTDDKPEDRQRKLNEAFVISTGKPAPKINASGAGGGNANAMGGGSKPLNSELVGLAKKLGLTEQDIDKYGKK